MERVSVTSSNMALIGYNDAEKILEVEFNSGSVYQYYGVEEEVFEAMINAGSVGKFFNANVKDVYTFS